MGRRTKHVQVLVTADQVAKVNEVMLRNGYGPDYLTIDVENAAKQLTHKAVETLADDPEYAAIQMALAKVPTTKKTVVKKRVVGKHKPKRELDSLLASKKLKRHASSVKKKKVRVSR